MNFNVLCADVGSIARGRFGWASSQSSISGTDIAKFADTASILLSKGTGLALGFECPLFIPAPDQNSPRELTSARGFEGSRPWSAGSGAAVLCTGLAETRWVFERIRLNLSGFLPPVFFDWRLFKQNGEQGLLVWEAFVSGKKKRPTNVEDAQVAVDAFLYNYPNISSVDITEKSNVFSLAAASLLRAGWPIPQSLLNEQCMVICA